MRLNLGCGERKKDGYVNVDLCGNPDQRVDLSVFPWPWENDSCDEVYSEHFLEHVADYEKTVLEMHRILKPNGVLHFKVPHHRSPFAQWHLHLQNFSTYTCDILCGNVPYQWDNRRLFNKKQVRINFPWLVGHPILQKIFSLIANISPLFWDWLGLPIDEVEFIGTKNDC